MKYKISAAERAHIEGKPVVVLRVDYTGESGRVYPEQFEFDREDSASAYRQIEATGRELELRETRAALETRVKDLESQPNVIEAAQQDLLKWADGHAKAGTEFTVRTATETV